MNPLITSVFPELATPECHGDRYCDAGGHRAASIAGPHRPECDRRAVGGILDEGSSRGRPARDPRNPQGTIIMTLEAFAAVPGMCVETLVGCRSPTPEGLTDAERVEA